MTVGLAPQADATGAGDASALAVALLAPCYWPEVRRGGERLVHELASGLIALGHGPRLITSHPGPPRRSVEDGIPITRHWRPPDARLRRRRFEDYLTHVPFSYGSLALGRYDVAHAFYPTDALAASRWSRRSGRPSVLTYLGLPHRVGISDRRLRLEITMRAVEGCTAVVAISRTARDAFRRWLAVDAHMIYPAIDTRTFTPGDSRSETPTIYCAAAADEPRKRVGLLVDAFRQLRRERPEVRLLLDRPRDPRLAAALSDGAEGVELIEPAATAAGLAETYRQAWVSALPSIADAFGLVLAEALACGTAVVGSDLGAIPEVVDRPEIGRLFRGDEPAALARALLEALELAAAPATSAACRARAEEFSAERSAADYERLYRELLGRSDGA